MQAPFREGGILYQHGMDKMPKILGTSGYNGNTGDRDNHVSIGIEEESGDGELESLNFGA